MVTMSVLIGAGTPMLPITSDFCPSISVVMVFAMRSAAALAQDPRRVPPER
jgi:hypothetical protein